MKRSGPPARRTPLKNTSSLQRRSELPRRDGQLRRTPAAAPAKASARRPARDTGPTAPVRALVAARAGGRCERCGVDAARHGGQVHHRRPRGAGGSRRADTNWLCNLVLLCLTCHGEVESRRAAARASGWLVPQGHDPAVWPVVLFDGRRVFLDPAEGRYLPAPPPSVLPRTG